MREGQEGQCWFALKVCMPLKEAKRLEPTRVDHRPYIASEGAA